MVISVISIENTKLTVFLTCDQFNIQHLLLAPRTLQVCIILNFGLQERITVGIYLCSQLEMLVLSTLT